MRSLSLLLVLFAGCSSSTSSTTTDATTTPSDGGAGGLSCGATLTAYCASNSCDQSLTAAKQDKGLCPASMNTCGNYNVVTRNMIDTGTVYYYQGDQLVAVTSFSLPARRNCLAGPSTFEEPTCGATSQTLPACM